jgi:hypothetical protein
MPEIIWDLLILGVIAGLILAFAFVVKWFIHLVE